jgi:iron complex outermembrane receptor protein
MNLHSDASLSASAATSFESIERQNPQNQVYIRSSFDLPGHVEFDVTGRYVDTLTGFSPTIPSYFTVDARLAWKPKPNVEFAIVGQNLVEDHHAEFGTSSLVRSPIVEVERSVYATVTLKW